MIIRTAALYKQYVKVNNSVITSPQLSDGEFRVYCYYSSLKDGQNFSDNYVCKALRINKNTLAKRKRVLKKVGLFVTEQISPRIYTLFIGNFNMSAATVQYAFHEKEKLLQIEEKK